MPWTNDGPTSGLDALVACLRCLQSGAGPIVFPVHETRRWRIGDFTAAPVANKRLHASMPCERHSFPNRDVLPSGFSNKFRPQARGGDLSERRIRQFCAVGRLSAFPPSPATKGRAWLYSAVRRAPGRSPAAANAVSCGCKARTARAPSAPSRDGARDGPV